MNTSTETRLKPQEFRWLGEPVVQHHGTYDQVAEEIPYFGRRAFGLYTAPAAEDELPFVMGENPYYDEVIRLHEVPDQVVPVGIVSKSYKLIQHRELFENAVRALDEAKVPLSKVSVFLTLTRFGGRMALRFVLPEAFGIDPGDSYPLRLRLECFNSVDGSTRLSFLMSWYRLICSNGLAARATLADETMIHTEGAEVPDIRALIIAGIESIADENVYFGRAITTRVDDAMLRGWIDGELKKRWGALAAARTYLICQTGFDGVFSDPFDKQPPSQKGMRRTERVPGAPAKAENAYAVAQALSWIAGQRLDVQEQTQYMREMPQLMQALSWPAA
ncbi:MAG: DUF932 domain-containing protein [Acidobacteriota bacterium]|nr:DUF932 domain-containing protein [Acidobacteriota bacterium]